MTIPYLSTAKTRKQEALKTKSAHLPREFAPNTVFPQDCSTSQSNAFRQTYRTTQGSPAPRTKAEKSEQTTRNQLHFFKKETHVRPLTRGTLDKIRALRTGYRTHLSAQPHSLNAYFGQYTKLERRLLENKNAPAKCASTGRTCTHAGFNGKGKTKTAKTPLSDENTHPHRNHTAVAQTVIGDFSQKRGASGTSTRNVDDLLLFAHITLYVHCLVFSTRFRSNISLNFHFLTDA